MSDQRNPSSRDPGQGDPHEDARQKTEDALDAYVKGNEEKGNKLVDEAKATDPSAVEEVMQDLEEDASSDHTAPDEGH